MKYALCMMVIKNAKYIAGACISAYIHKNYLKKLDIDVELIVMIDDEINVYRKEIEKYFDRVILIDLWKMNIDSECIIIDKYKDMMPYYVNKWQIFQYEEYNKILFVDISILPLTLEFYDLFHLETPAISMRRDKTYHNTIVSKDEKVKIAGCLCLITPSKKVYFQYMSFLEKMCDNYKAEYISGVDETTLAEFLLSYKQESFRVICKEYFTIPWDDDITDIKALCFSSLIKPWLKIPCIQWYDEYIWHLLGEKAMMKSKVIKELHQRYHYETLKHFISKSYNIEKSPYNLECSDFPEMQKLEHLIRNTEYSKTNYDKAITLNNEMFQKMTHEMLCNDMKKIEKIL